MPIVVQTILLLTLSNVFMTFAWYGHLNSLKEKAWYIAVLASWGIAFFEYLLQVPANRIGKTQYSLAELKIMQEVISLSVFVPIALLFFKESFKWNYLWASLCIVGAVFFMFRDRMISEIEGPPVQQQSSAKPPEPADQRPQEGNDGAE